MQKRRALFAKFEAAWLRMPPQDHREQLRIHEALYREAVALGIFPLQDPLEGIEVDIRLAEVLNVRKAA